MAPKLRKNITNADARAARLALITAHTDNVLRAWAQSPAAGIEDPVVVIADPTGGDTLARAICTGAALTVGLVSARELVAAHGKHLAEPVTLALRTLKREALFVVCVARGGATCGYVGTEKSTGRLVLTGDAT